MYTFDHEATVQTPALTDYRYIGNVPYMLSLMGMKSGE